MKDLIGKKNNSKNVIEMELSNLETLRLFSWLEQDINKYKGILRNILEDINEKNRKNKWTAQTNTERNKRIRKRLYKEDNEFYIGSFLTIFLTIISTIKMAGINK